jgi:hypothetical protein
LSSKLNLCGVKIHNRDESLHLSCRYCPNLVVKVSVAAFKAIYLLVDGKVAFVTNSSEKKASHCGIGGRCVATPLQRRHTYPKKEKTTGIHQHISITVIFIH